MSLAGTIYKKGYSFYAEGYGGKFAINLNSKYSIISGLMGLSDNHNDYQATVKFLGDGKLFNTYTFEPGSLPTNVSVPVKGVKKLEIWSSTPVNSDRVHFVNVKIN